MDRKLDEFHTGRHGQGALDPPAAEGKNHRKKNPRKAVGEIPLVLVMSGGAMGVENANVDGIL